MFSRWDRKIFLFRRPPGPHVFVTTAHCTYLCKNGAGVVDNCCCKTVGNFDCSKDINKCGSTPSVVEMTG